MGGGGCRRMRVGPRPEWGRPARVQMHAAGVLLWELDAAARHSFTTDNCECAVGHRTVHAHGHRESAGMRKEGSGLRALPTPPCTCCATPAGRGSMKEEWGKPEDVVQQPQAVPAEAMQPNLGLSGKLAAETNKVRRGCSFVCACEQGWEPAAGAPSPGVGCCAPPLPPV